MSTFLFLQGLVMLRVKRDTSDLLPGHLVTSTKGGFDDDEGSAILRWREVHDPQERLITGLTTGDEAKSIKLSIYCKVSRGRQDWQPADDGVLAETN
jgi:hypothetical protein